jgi:acetyl-CoA carboxylase biotin carboxyl carrier protein
VSNGDFWIVLAASIVVASSAMATQVLAHITGTVWKVEKKVGDAVASGEPIIIIESMKMEMPVESPQAGRVLEIRVEEKQPVEEGAVVAVVE